MKSRSSSVFGVNRGATLVEYGVLSGIVSVAAIVAVLNTGNEIEDVFSATNTAMAQVDTGSSTSQAALFQIADGQAFSFPLEAGPGHVVGQVLTTGGTAGSFSLISGADGLSIDSGGYITVRDAEAFGPSNTSSTVLIEAVDEGGVVDQGTVIITRRDYEDVPGDEFTWAVLYPNQTKISTFENTSDHDWFKLVIEDPGQSLSLQIKNHNGPNGRAYWFDMAIADAELNPIAFNDETNHGVLFVQDVPPGTYFVQVSTPDVIGDYEIFAEVLPDDRPEFENAIDVAANTRIARYNMASETGDMYRFTHEATGDLRFFMNSDNSNGKAMVWPEMAIYDANRAQIDIVKGGNEAYKLIENAPAGDYYVLALSDNYLVSGDYTFLAEPTLDVIESTFQDAVQLQPNVSSYSNYTREESGDMWTFDLDSHSDIQFEMVADDSNGNGLSNTEMTIYDGAQQEIANAFRASDNRFVVNDLPAGTYYILATARNGYDGDYRIAANQVDDIPGDFAGATPIPSSSTGFGDYTAIENGDMYSFTLAETSDFSAGMNSYTAVWPSIRLYDASQRQIASGSGTADESTLGMSALAPGDYYILFNHSSKWSGTYDFSIQSTPTSP